MNQLKETGFDFANEFCLTVFLPSGGGGCVEVFTVGKVYNRSERMGKGLNGYT